MVREAVERDEFRTPCSPAGVSFVQVTNDPDRSATTGCQNIIRWTPDSKRFFFYRTASDDGSQPHGVWRCDVEDGFDIRPVHEWETMFHSHTVYGHDARGRIAETFVVDRSGEHLLFMARDRDRLELRRVHGESREEEVVADVPAPLTTGWMIDISADGSHVCFHVFLGDGETEGAPWGLHVFDLEAETSRTVELFNRSHKGAQYRRGAGFCDADEHPGVHDMLTRVPVEDRMPDGSWFTPPDGTWPTYAGEPDRRGHGVVFRDDGSGLPRGGDAPCRIVPLPEAPRFIGSHSAWRGRDARGFVASMYNVTPERWRAPFIEAAPVDVSAADRLADRAPDDAEWTDLTRFVSRADACHFDFDASGRRIVSDTDGYVNPGPCLLYVGTYIEPTTDEAPYLKTTLLGVPRTSWKGQPAHPHPFLSPDGRYAVFQSDFSGRPQVNVAYDFEYPD